MWLPLNRSLFIAVATLVLGGCAHKTHVIESIAQACPSISEHTVVAVKIYSGMDYWDFAWRSKGITLERQGRDEVQKIPVDSSDEVGNKLYQAAGPGAQNHYSMGKPAVLSSDGKYILMSYSKDRVVSSEIGLFDVASHKLVRMISVPGSAISLAWAPNSESFAILDNEDVTTIRTAKDLMVALFGWKLHYYNAYLEIQSVDGSAQCTIQVASQLPEAIGYLKWNKE